MPRDHLCLLKVRSSRGREQCSWEKALVPQPAHVPTSRAPHASCPARVSQITVSGCGSSINSRGRRRGEAPLLLYIFLETATRTRAGMTPPPPEQEVHLQRCDTLPLEDVIVPLACCVPGIMHPAKSARSVSGFNFNSSSTRHDTCIYTAATVGSRYDICCSWAISLTACCYRCILVSFLSTAPARV